MQTTETEMRSRSFPQYACNTTRKKRTQESSHRKNYGNPRYSTTRIYMHNQHAIYKRHTNSLSLLYTHTLTNTRAPAGRVHEKAFPHFHTDQIITGHHQKKKCNPKLVSASKNERPPGRTPYVYARSSSIFHSRDADRLAEQPQEQRPLEHEDGVQVRPVQREPEHRDPGPVVLQVRHCNASEDGPGRQQQF